MGNHRADHRAASRTRSERPEEAYVGRRVAGRETPATAVRRAAEAVAPPLVEQTIPTATTTTALKPAVPGKRKAVKHAGPRGPLFKTLPPLPVAAGVATLAIAVGGVVTSTEPQLTAAERVAAPNAATGAIGSGVFDATGRAPVVSRDSERDALEDASDAELVAQAEQQAEQRNARIGELAQQAETAAKEINLNAWVLPIAPGAYRLSATFNQPGAYWSSGYHTGLDFAAPEGTPIRAVANGVITFVGYDGAYGNKTVLTLEDGTELWFCHQSSFGVEEGDVVSGGDVIGAVGNTGNSFGAHLHLEVRPGGGDPADPFDALAVNGVAP